MIVLIMSKKNKINLEKKIINIIVLFLILSALIQMIYNRKSILKCKKKN